MRLVIFKKFKIEGKKIFFCDVTLSRTVQIWGDLPTTSIIIIIKIFKPITFTFQVCAALSPSTSTWACPDHTGEYISLVSSSPFFYYFQAPKFWMFFIVPGLLFILDKVFFDMKLDIHFITIITNIIIAIINIMIIIITNVINVFIRWSACDAVTWSWISSRQSCSLPRLKHQLWHKKHLKLLVWWNKWSIATPFGG